MQPKLNGQPAAIGTQTSAGEVLHSMWDPGSLLTVSINLLRQGRLSHLWCLLPGLKVGYCATIQAAPGVQIVS